ncbi:MAG: hypothetical protein AAFR55_06240, partial [Pseudomonadota bacterium]
MLCRSTRCGPVVGITGERSARSAVVVATVLAMALGSAPGHAQTTGGPTTSPTSSVSQTGRTAPRSGPSDVDYAACQAQNTDAFKSAIQAITKRALTAGLSTLDYDAIVRDEWRKRDLDAVIADQVDAATTAVGDKLGLLDRARSLISTDRAKVLATEVAERVYRSDPVTTAIADLSNGVGMRVGNSIELSTIDAAGPAQKCVQAFLADRYGATVASAVERDAGAAFTVSAARGQADIGSGDMLIQNAGGLTGAVVLLVRRQMARLASRLGQRIVGAVLGRIVSVAAGGVGLALIAKDVFDLYRGVLPVIASEMKSPETTAKVQQELAGSLREQIDAQVDTLAEATSNRIVGIWRAFQRAHTKTLEIAERDAQFRSYIDTLTPAQLKRLDEVVALLLTKDGPAG